MLDNDLYQRPKMFPRNIWTRFRAALHLTDIGEFYQARQILEGIRYHSEAEAGIFDIYVRYLEHAEKKKGAVQRINIPCDYLGSSNQLFLKPFQKLNPEEKVPSPYPWSMALPPLVGTGNDVGFLRDAAAVLSGTYAPMRKRLAVCYAPLSAKPGDSEATLRSLSKLAFDGRMDIFTFKMSADIPALHLPGGGEIHRSEAPFLDATSVELMQRALPEYDLVLFLSGAAQFDTMALHRALNIAEISDNVFQPLIGLKADADFGPWLGGAHAQSIFSRRYAFRNVNGMNFIISPQLLRATGLPDSRFNSALFAGRELAYRAHIRGAYFMPLSIRELKDYNDERGAVKDRELFISKCPNHWDRKDDKSFIVPKVSVYIPAYNASKYIERAVDSVLEQDMKDLDVCIANDGSSDETLALIDSRYGNEPRVRVLDNPNGGIGYASNSAIRMSDSQYIGQLDSDDCLKPGAVRRLIEYLDEHPKVVCAYGSCERIDAQGQYIKDEYSWPVFSREKMMITSIVHHFRMFRRYAWERTTGFREDIVNGVDYDIFLKISETGEFHHIDEKLYQRRWHGENTSSVNEHHQTSNTYRVQREALKRLGMSRNWDIHLPDPNMPRKVSYKLNEGTKVLMFWPDYSRSNPYQKLLYRSLRQKAEVVSGNIAAAIRLIESKSVEPGKLTFHLHWLNAILRDHKASQEAQDAADKFVENVKKFIWKGGQFIWTVHNTISHDAPFPEIERALSAELAQIAHKLHFHSAASIDEVDDAFPIPRDKVMIARHGNYISAYPDFITRDAAREELGIAPEDDVIVFTGQIRGYKGIDKLITAFRRILAERPQTRLVLAGKSDDNPLQNQTPPMSSAESERVIFVNRFIEDSELQVFLRAADMAAYPYEKILTSGSLLLALSFGVPTVIPRVGMTAEVLDSTEAGVLYDAEAGVEALEAALRDLLAAKDAGRLGECQAAARTMAEHQKWLELTV